jgi:hypothetical protein
VIRWGWVWLRIRLGLAFAFLGVWLSELGAQIASVEIEK